MLKITEIIVAKIKNIWSRCRDIDQVRKTKERGQYTNEFGVLNDENRQCGKYIQVSKFFALS